ncbi:MAG: BrnT family toxin [Elusimicrobia bacterium]|nr:BrnT family toxin [Elusimicrobiota bacterium]
MRLKTDESAAQWLHDFVADPENFDWDEGNIRKNLKHGYSAEQIESLFLQTEYIFAGKIIEPAHDEWRGLVLGLTEGSRMTALILTRRGEKIRPISCRPMRKDERRFYENTTQKSG